MYSAEGSIVDALFLNAKNILVQYSNNFIRVSSLPSDKQLLNFQPHATEFKCLSNENLVFEEVFLTVSATQIKVWNYQGQLLTELELPSENRFTCLDTTGKFTFLAEHSKVICLHLKQDDNWYFDYASEFKLESPPLGLSCRNRLRANQH